MIVSDLSSTVAPLVYGGLWNVNPRLIALSGGSVTLGGIILAIGYWIIERKKRV
ncbi:MAG: hypothetical protein HXS47_01010 [Theionarchaea archaeon]|nr:hypothetical protein [Theionarchaea archaeon]